MTKILLQGGEIVTSGGVFKGDVLVEDKKIADVLESGEYDGDAEVIDCTGKTILPGLIDVHVHMRDFDQAYKEDWESGSMAAAAGGVTTVLDMPNNSIPITTLEALDKKRDLVYGRSYVNYGFYMGFDGKNIDQLEKAENIAGVKVYICDSTGDMGVGGEGLEDLFERTDWPIVFHAEDGDIIEKNKAAFLAEYQGREVDPAVHSKIRSTEAAVEGVKLVCGFAEKFPGRIHIAHVSCADEVDVIEKYRQYGVSCEVAPHHLLLSEDDYEELGNFAKMNPPVRSRLDVFEMWKDLKFGLIDIIATDHAPHTIEEKEESYQRAPSGVPELDTLLPIMLNSVNDEGMTFQELLKFCCEGPAELFGIPEKGRIEKGFDADLVVVDMELEREVKDEELFTKCAWSPYAGSRFKGWPVMTMVNGEIVFSEGKFVGEKAGEEIRF